MAAVRVEVLHDALKEGENVHLIDVRTSQEYQTSHIPTAVNIERAGEVDLDKDAPIVVYCSVGVRSAKFADQLIQLGFSNVHNLTGSIFQWANNGYPLVRGDSPETVVHPYNKSWGKLLKPELRAEQ